MREGLDSTGYRNLGTEAFCVVGHLRCSGVTWEVCEKVFESMKRAALTGCDPEWADWSGSGCGVHFPTYYGGWAMDLDSPEAVICAMQKEERVVRDCPRGSPAGFKGYVTVEASV